MRIYPLYLLALAVNWALSSGGIPSPIHNLSDVLRHLALLEGRQVFWTIPVEFVYYLISPLVLTLLWPLYRRRPWLAMAVFATAITCLWYLRTWPQLPMPLFLRFLPVLGFGTLLALLHRRIRIPGGIGLALFALGRLKPLRILGTLSFSIYLLHKSVLALCQAYLPDPWALQAFVLGTLAISLATYTFVERPLAQIRLHP